MVVVVDVHARVGGPALPQVLDEIARRPLLPGAVVGPARLERPGAVGTACDEPEEEEEAALDRPEGIPFEVQEDVAVVRLGQQLQAMPPGRIVAGLGEVERRGFGEVDPRLDLEPRLGDQPLESLRADRRYLDGTFRRASQASQTGQGGDGRLLQIEHVGRPDAGDVDERVLVAPLRVADGDELAELAMRAGHRLGVLHGCVVVQQLAQVAAQPVPVGMELPRDERLDTPRPEPEVHAFGRGTGRGAQGVGVEAELEHVPGLGLGAGELGIERLVGARALGRVVDLHQEVGDAPHAVVHEGHLVDDVVPVVPRGAHPGDPLVEALARLPWRHLVDAASLGAVMRQTLGLVLGPLVGEEPGEAPEPGELGRQEARIEAVPQREVVAAVEPGGDLRG